VGWPKIRILTRTFHFRKHGGKAGALLAARNWQDHVLRKLRLLKTKEGRRKLWRERVKEAVSSLHAQYGQIGRETT
jgi:hypothetical protein